ncbi:CPBP family intramembrane glutamic endopeptidase [Rhizobium leguminosarum]|uniref:CPBP family intramembrane glutamic endopeptidase n=1 Tax=Rhizobium leguminosarum TaxID=384 RepID=UPI00037768A3|nr:CPBP family intramembrane glutamic endopeptidase [Rhizobium leguminosarum]
MSFLTHYLDVFILMATSCPVSSTISAAKVGDNRKAIPGGFYFNYASILFLMLASCFLLINIEIEHDFPSFNMAIVTVLTAIFSVLGEIIIGFFMYSGREEGRSTVSRQSNRASYRDIVWALLIAAEEELLFRIIWMQLIILISASGTFATVLSALIFALNHFGFGWRAMAPKFYSGLLFGGLYLTGGGNMWCPVIAHVFANLLIFVIGWRRYVSA